MKVTDDSRPQRSGPPVGGTCASPGQHVHPGEAGQSTKLTNPARVQVTHSGDAVIVELSKLEVMLTHHFLLAARALRGTVCGQVNF